MRAARDHLEQLELRFTRVYLLDQPRPMRDRHRLADGEYARAANCGAHWSGGRSHPWRRSTRDQRFLPDGMRGCIRKLGSRSFSYGTIG